MIAPQRFTSFGPVLCSHVNVLDALYSIEYYVYTELMYVTEVPNRNSPPAILLRESFRQDGKVKNRTLLNISSWPAPRIAALRRLLRGELDGDPASEPRMARKLDLSEPAGDNPWRRR